jgi:hypothetical protein
MLIVLFQDETTIGDLIQKIAYKLSLKTDLESFAVYESIRTSEKIIDRLLKPADKCPKQLPAPSVFLFKKRFFFYDNTGDQIVIHMEFIQLREEVLQGRYVLTVDDALELGALDMRVTFGVFDTQKHKSGFILFAYVLINIALFSSVNMLKKYIPKPLLESRKLAVWEKLLLDRFRQISSESITSEYEAKLRYITRFNISFLIKN